MTVIEFQIKTYGWQELAMLYAPGLTKESAGKRLSIWVASNEMLVAELQNYGWKKGRKMLTPLQVQVIAKFFGEP